MSLLLALLQYTGSISGIVAAIMVTSLRPRVRWLAFLIWALSDVLWIVYGSLTDQWGLTAQYILYTGTSLLGWWRLRGVTA